MDRFFPSPQQDEPWFRVGSLDVTTTVLTVGLGVVGMFVYAISRAAWETLVLIPDDILAGQVWRLVSWPFATVPDIWDMLSLAIFYLFGREIERRAGRVPFLWLLAICTIIPSIFAAATGVVVGGIDPLGDALFLLFVLMYPTARTFFNIQLWVLGAVFLGLRVLQLVGDRYYEGLGFLFLMLATAVLCGRSFGLLTDERIPRVPLPASITGASGRTRTARRPRRRGGRRRGPADVVPIQRPVSRPQPFNDAEIDALLDKIAAHGIDSLTAAERAQLDQHSKRLRGDE